MGKRRRSMFFDEGSCTRLGKRRMNDLGTTEDDDDTINKVSIELEKDLIEELKLLKWINSKIESSKLIRYRNYDTGHNKVFYLLIDPNMNIVLDRFGALEDALIVLGMELPNEEEYEVIARS